MTNPELIRAARASLSQHFDRPPLDMGVEAGIVWAIVASPGTGVNGYALVPAEGHPWSTGFPGDEDMYVDRDRSRKNLRLFWEIQKRKGGGTAPEDMGRVFEEMAQTEGYEKMPSDNLDDYLVVHGGVTYYHHPWVGFDTGHAWDIWGPEYDPHGISARFASVDHKWDVHWTPELVAEEAKRLARQLAEIGVLEKNLEIEEEKDR